MPLRYFRLVTSLIAACQVKWGLIQTDLVLRNTLVFLRHCLYRFGDPATFLLISRLFSTNCHDDAGENPLAAVLQHFGFGFFLFGHGRDRLKGAPIRLHDIGLAPLNRVGVAKQPFILSANFNKGKVGREFRGDVRRARAVLRSAPSVPCSRARWERGEEGGLLIPP